MNRFMLIAFLVLVSGAISGGGRRPWQWSAGERLHERLDPVKVTARVRQYAADFPQAAASNEHAQPPSRNANRVYVIDGRRDPHLFLPHELFDAVLTGFGPDPTLRARQRELYGRGVSAMGLDADAFWRQLEASAATYIALRQSEATDWRSLCRARYTALQAARREIQHFDVILYWAVASHSQMSGTLDDRTEVQLREAAEGCR